MSAVPQKAVKLNHSLTHFLIGPPHIVECFFNKMHIIHFNSLWPDDAIWRHRSGSTLAQVMACCLTAPSHYLNQSWLIISKVLCHSSPRGQWVNTFHISLCSSDTIKNSQNCFWPTWFWLSPKNLLSIQFIKISLALGENLTCPAQFLLTMGDH